MTATPRKKIFPLYLSEEEKEILVNEAKEHHMSTSAYMRYKLFTVGKKSKKN